MFRTKSKPRGARAGLRKAAPRCESLEPRTVLSFVAPAGTISGAVINEATGLPVPKVQIQLINSAGRVVGKTFTNAQGLYLFNVKSPDAYVVREMTPKGFFQITPSFSNGEAEGSFNTATAGTTSASQSASWNYGFGTDPAAGPVGPFAWDKIAPAAAWPFQSPINITGKPTNLSAILSVNYAANTPTKTINNGHQIQVQFPTDNSTDTISLVGQTYDLTQFHYHAPSETTVNGRHYLAEEHFVNTNPGDGGRDGRGRVLPARQAQQRDPADPRRRDGQPEQVGQLDDLGRRDRLLRPAADEPDGLVLQGLADHAAGLAAGQLAGLLDADHPGRQPGGPVRGRGRLGRLPARTPARSSRPTAACSTS